MFRFSYQQINCLTNHYKKTMTATLFLFAYEVINFTQSFIQADVGWDPTSLI